MRSLFAWLSSYSFMRLFLFKSMFAMNISLVHHCMKYLGRGIYTPQHLNGRTARFSEHQFNECSVNDFPYLALDLYLNVWDLNWYHGNCFVCSNKHFLSSYKQNGIMISWGKIRLLPALQWFIGPFSNLFIGNPTK